MLTFCIARRASTITRVRASKTTNKKFEPRTMKKSSPSESSTAMDLLLQQRSRLTPFQFRVLRALCQVPPGKVTTYKELARAVHCKSHQAIGQALKRNPFAPIVPCHRVVASDMSLGGFCGRRSGSKIDEKIKLLRGEGVDFLDSSCTTVCDDCLFTFT